MPEVGLTLPLLALLFLVAAVFSSTTSSGYGRNPYLKPASNASADGSGSRGPAGVASSSVSPPAGSVATTNPPPASQTISSGTQLVASPSNGSLSGGMGGGAMPSSTAYTTATPTSSQTTTLTVPSVNLQAGDKTLVSTSPTSVTIN